MREIRDSLLLINENDKVFRKRAPFWIILKGQYSNQTKLLVTRIIFEDDNMILFEIENETVHHTKCDIVYEDIDTYEKSNNFVLL